MWGFSPIMQILQQQWHRSGSNYGRPDSFFAHVRPIVDDDEDERELTPEEKRELTQLVVRMHRETLESIRRRKR